jgi:hypothetical protein
MIEGGGRDITRRTTVFTPVELQLRRNTPALGGSGRLIELTTYNSERPFPE